VTLSDIHIADAEQAKSTGAMIALLPRGIDADALARPGGEPPEELHLTLFFFASDVTEVPFPTELLARLDEELGMFPVIYGKLFAQALFNFDGDEPCAVMLAGDSELLSQLKHEVIDPTVSVYGPQDPDLLQQHMPWIPHITLGYGMGFEQLPQRTEPITFDRVLFAWAGERFIFPLVEV
jgi:hypothetical protein